MICGHSEVRGNNEDEKSAAQVLCSACVSQGIKR